MRHDPVGDGSLDGKRAGLSMPQGRIRQFVNSGGEGGQGK